ncbi:glycosyltransferase family 1 protein [bacterium]|nr:glycosyltransferase family 1 protein [bacterium]
MSTSRRHVVAFTIPGQGHINRLLPVVAGLCEMGVSVDFFAHAMARRQIERTGARFVDVYAGRDMDVPDGTSLPVPMRNVSFAGYWADDIVREVAPLRPALVLHDTFAVIGRVVAFHLAIPRVNMRAGHNLEPTRALAALQASDAVRVADACHASVALLRQRHGIPDASPFSYFFDDAADLNICSEPPEFLAPEERAPFEPLAFFGSYWPAGSGAAPAAAPPPFGPDAAASLRIYVALGTAAWMTFPDYTMALLEVLADAIAAHPQARGLIALGSPFVPPGTEARLRRANVRVEQYVDQIAALRSAGVFITHNGLNSTHEAIMHGVPMISFPLFGDQPALAARCQALGLAVPLGPAIGQLPSVADVRRALDRVQAEGQTLRQRLAEARQWEIAVMERRPQVLQRIVALMDRRA